MTPAAVGRMPNLFVVGAPRCGTTSMHGYLDQHPDIYMSPEKEPHYFCDDLNASGDRHQGGPRYGVFRSEAQYRWLFRDAAEQRYVGEASPLYMASCTAAPAIHAASPDARIVCMVREPVGYLYSLHQLFLYHLDEDEPSFERALDLEEVRRAGERLPRTVRIPELLHYRAMAAFTEQIERYREAFGGDRVHVIVQDDLARDTAGVYAKVLAFLDLEPAPVTPEFERVNAAKAPRSRALAHYLQCRHPSLFEVYRHADFPAGPRIPVRGLLPGLPLRLQAPLFRLLSRVNTKAQPRRPLDEGLRSRLRQRFRPEVERLSHLLRRDLLTEWGYGAESASSTT